MLILTYSFGPHKNYIFSKSIKWISNENFISCIRDFFFCWETNTRNSMRCIAFWWGLKAAGDTSGVFSGRRQGLPLSQMEFPLKTYHTSVCHNSTWGRAVLSCHSSWPALRERWCPEGKLETTARSTGPGGTWPRRAWARTVPGEGLLRGSVLLYFPRGLTVMTEWPRPRVPGHLFRFQNLTEAGRPHISCGCTGKQTQKIKLNKHRRCMWWR